MPWRRPRAMLADALTPSWPLPLPVPASPPLRVIDGAVRSTGPTALPEHAPVRTEPAEGERLPFVHRGVPGSRAALEYVRTSGKSVAAAPDPESIRRQVEERVERTIVERMESLVARELSPDSAPLSRLSERVAQDLSQALVLERERLGWR